MKTAHQDIRKVSYAKNIMACSHINRYLHGYDVGQEKSKGNDNWENGDLKMKKAVEKQRRETTVINIL